ncbi:unnamed protein product [Aureobasidium pullulans]|nr:unnamed protein product [Aureobasidium pullulans]
MRLSFALPALLLTPFAYAKATTAVKTTTCSATDLKTFNGDVQYGEAFCEFWLIISRSTSPLPNLSASALTNVCNCVLKVLNHQEEYCQSLEESRHYQQEDS